MSVQDPQHLPYLFVLCMKHTIPKYGFQHRSIQGGKGRAGRAGPQEAWFRICKDRARKSSLGYMWQTVSRLCSCFSCMAGADGFSALACKCLGPGLCALACNHGSGCPYYQSYFTRPVQKENSLTLNRVFKDVLRLSLR